MRFSDVPVDTWQGPGIRLDPDNVAQDFEADAPDDGFARRQDAITHLNSALAEADVAATQALEDDRARFFAEGGPTDFAARQRERLTKLRRAALTAAPDAGARDGLAHSFDGLSERLLRRATTAEHEARVRARADGAERALASYRSAALADPDGLPDRIADAEQLLARMVEAGTDPDAAAERGRMFRAEIGSAVFHDLLERDPSGGLARIDNGTFDGVLDEESKRDARERLSRIAQADAEAANASAAFEARAAELDRAADRRATIRTLAAGLRDGAMHEGHVARSLYRGEIGEADADALTTHLKKLTEQRLRRAEALDRFDALVDGDGEAEETQWEPEVIDAWIARERQRGTPISTIATDSFGATRSVPNPIIGAFRTLILSASPEDSVQAGREMHTLQLISPDAAQAVIGRLPAQEAAKLSALVQYAHLPLPPDRIEDLANEALAQMQTPPSDDPKEIPVPRVPPMQRNPETDPDFVPPERPEQERRRQMRPPQDSPKPWIEPWEPDITPEPPAIEV